MINDTWKITNNVVLTYGVVSHDLVLYERTVSVRRGFTKLLSIASGSYMSPPVATVTAISRHSMTAIWNRSWYSIVQLLTFETVHETPNRVFFFKLQGVWKDCEGYDPALGRHVENGEHDKMIIWCFERVAMMSVKPLSYSDRHCIVNTSTHWPCPETNMRHQEEFSSRCF